MSDRRQTIGEVARRTGLAASALRFYEERGLVAPAGRTPAGYRLYDGEAVARVRFIRRAQSLGLSLDEIGELLRAADRSGAPETAERLRLLVAAKLTSTRRQIRGLEELARQLESVHVRLEHGAGDCGCHHLGSCDCVAFGTSA